MQKTKFEKPENKKTAATFSLDEVRAFQLAGYAEHRRALYLEKVSQRERNPRLDEYGREILSPISTVADVDMTPLTTRQNMARFNTLPSTPVNGDGYDAETEFDSEGRVIAGDDDMYVGDRTDNIPTPHEVRSRELDKKFKRVRQAHADAQDERVKSGDTPTHKDKAEATPDLAKPPEKGSA